MKIKILALIIGIGLLIAGGNVFAAGDLIVNGKVGIGESTPLYPLHITTTDEATSLRLEPTIDNLSVLNNFGAYYKIRASDTTLTNGIFSAFAGNVVFTGAGTVTRLQGAENNIVLASDTASTIENAVGSKVELRLSGANAAHTLTNYYGFHSFGNASGSGNISGTDWRHAYYENFPSFGGTVTNVSGLWIDKQTMGTNNYGIVLNGDGDGADIVFGASQEARIYSSGGRLYVDDSFGNQTIISPHDPETGEWIYFSKNIKTGKVMRVNMEKLVKAVEKLTGETFMIESIEAK